MKNNQAFAIIVAFQDSIVSMNSPGIGDIDQAYKHYLDSVSPLILKKGDFSFSGINAASREELFDRIPKKELGEIFIVGDTIEYFSMDVKKKVKKYFPYQVKMNNYGEFVELLENRADENPFFKNYYLEFMKTGDISPACFGMILRDYRHLNFSDPYSRLLYAVTILRVNEKIKDRFVH